MINLFDPQYEIVADGVTDNSAGIQAWATDVCAGNDVGYIPPSPRCIAFRSPIVFEPQNGPYCKIRIISDGFAQFNYLGEGAAFGYKGLRNSVISGIGVIFGNAPLIRDSVAHEVQFDSRHGNSANITFENLFVQMNGSKNCVGFRIGQDAAGRSSAPFITLRQCCFVDVSPANGNIGVHIGGSEAYCILLEQCTGSQLAQYLLNGAVMTRIAADANPGDTVLTVDDTSLLTSAGSVRVAGVKIDYTGKTATTLTGVTVTQALHAGAAVAQYVEGQGVYSGSGLVTVHKGGGSNNLCDFWNLCNRGTLRLNGTRWETGRRLYQDSAVIPTGFISHLEIDGGYLASYSPDSAPIWVRGSGSVYAKGWSVYGNATPWTAANPLVSFAGNYAGNHGSLTMDRCDVYGADPFYENPQNFPVAIRNAQLTDAAGHAVATVNASRNGAC